MSLRIPTGALIERFPIVLPDGRRLFGALYCTTARRGGRRIIVTDASGELQHDTNDQYDYGNACNALDLWLNTQVAQQPARA